ncbi:MAG TPA: cupin domain-containing protein [Streptosporangiaceae bacterium]|jgi:quercetin dioxygenase-like cupin family protein
MTDLTAPDAGGMATIRAAGDAPATWALGSLFERLVTAGHTGGLLDAAIVTQPPGLAPPEHVHTREAEAWYVLDGSLIYRAGDQEASLTAGDFIYLPAGVPHAFRITGRSPARCLALVLPGSLLDIYDQVGRPAAAPGLPDGGLPAAEIARWLELAPGYGIQVTGPPIPDPDAA